MIKKILFFFLIIFFTNHTNAKENTMILKLKDGDVVKVLKGKTFKFFLLKFKSLKIELLVIDTLSSMEKRYSLE